MFIAGVGGCDDDVKSVSVNRFTLTFKLVLATTWNQSKRIRVERFPAPFGFSLSLPLFHTNTHSLTLLHQKFFLSLSWASVNRLGYLWKFVTSNLLANVAQNIGDFFELFWKVSLYEKLLKHLFGQLLETFGLHF